MNSLQLELDNINQQLELLTYRKNQLDSIMSEYSDVINRVRNLVSSMEDANIEPSNLLMEIEGIIFNIEELKTDNYDARFNQLCDESEAYAEEFLKEHPEQPTESEPTEKPTPEHFDFDLRLFPKAEKQEPEAPKLNALGLPVQTEAEPVKLMACVPVASTPETPSKA